MPRELKILLPENDEARSFDILIAPDQQVAKLNYRYEIWDMEADSALETSAVDYLKTKIKNLDSSWEIAEIFAREGNHIPVLLKHTDA